MKSNLQKHKAATMSFLASGAAFAMVLLGTAMAYGRQNGNLAFVSWTEPKEKSFSLQVPKGWKITGGLTRAGKTDVRQSVVAASPSGDLAVSIGDASLPTFATLGEYERQSGIREGSAMDMEGSFTLVYLHYMSAVEFNRMYLRKGIVASLDNFTIVSERDFPNTARQIESKANNIKVSVGATEFSGTDKQTGKKISGLAITLTELMPGSIPKYSQMWNARPIVLGGLEDDNQMARMKTAGVVLQKMQATWKINPVWSKQEAERMAQVSDDEAQKAQDYVKKTGDNAKKFFYENRARQAKQQEQFLGYIRSTNPAVGIHD